MKDLQNKDHGTVISATEHRTQELRHGDQVDATIRSRVPTNLGGNKNSTIDQEQVE